MKAFIVILVCGVALSLSSTDCNAQFFSEDNLRRAANSIQVNQPSPTSNPVRGNNIRSTGNQGNTTLSRDASNYVRAVSGAVQEGACILNNPQGAANRMMNDPQYAKDMERRQNERFRAADRMEQRVNNAHRQVNNVGNNIRSSWNNRRR